MRDDMKILVAVAKERQIIANVTQEQFDKIQALANKNCNGNKSELIRMLADGKEIKRD